METRTIGKSDLQTSVVGFGGWPLGNRAGYGPTDEKEAIRAIHRAIELGVNLFDTSPGYGQGASQEWLGRVLKGRRDDVIIVSKGGTRPRPRKPGEEYKGPIRDSSREYLEEVMELSLRRLQTDYIDLFLIHWPDESRPFEEPMGVFADWQKQGKIRYGGVSNFNVAQMEECLEHFQIVCNQIGYNLFDRRPETDIFPFCQEHGLGIMSYGSLSYGLLTGTMTADTKFEQDDWRFTHPGWTGLSLFDREHFPHNLAIVERLKEIASGYGKTVAQLAVAWVLSNPIVAVALTGIRKPSEIEENVGAAEWRLTEVQKGEIEAVFRTSTAG